MFFSTLFTGVAFLSTTGWAQYVLEDDYTANGNFFDQFQFYNGSDPTHGYVDYVEREYAESAGLIKNDYGKVYMGVDHTGIASKNGRPAVRIESTKSYDSGLVIIDIEHMPGGICGTWPAFWMFGPNWPKNGEIDIIEGVNGQTTNDMTLHTGPGCSISRQSDMVGKVSTDNCDVNAEGQGNNEGCKIKTDDTRTYGKGFNENGGGVYATEITSDFINIFFFPRGSLPSDISSASPDPSSWGKPMAVFKGDCDIPSTFKNMAITFTNTFCGDWAGNVWSSGSCSSKADTCVDYVKNNPEAFEDAYWSVNSLKVYKHGSSPYLSSKVVGSDSTSFRPSFSSSASVSASSSASNNSSASSARPMYSTRPAGIAMPSGVDHDPFASEAPNTASPTATAESNANNGQTPSDLLPSGDNIAVASATSTATAAQISTESRQRPEGWASRGSRHGRPSERTSRHMKQHKRHGHGNRMI